MGNDRSALPTVLTIALLFSSMCLGNLVLAGTTQPLYIYGNQVTIKVYPTGSFIINPMDFPSRFSDSSSFWSFNIDGKVTTTYNQLVLDRAVTPVRTTQDGAIKVQYILEGSVLVDVTYREAGPAAWITVTFINLGATAHTVGARYLYDMNGKTVMPTGSNAPTTEVTYTAPAFQQLDIMSGTQREGLVPITSTYGTTPPSKLTIGTWDKTWSSNWDYVANSTVAIGTEPTIMIYWENLNLPASGHARIEHAFGSNFPSHTAKSQDLVIESITADPLDQFIGLKRTIKATVKNQGPAVSNIDIDFFVTDSAGKLAANGSNSRSIVAGGSVEVSWTYEVRKIVEVTAYVVADPSGDSSPQDNQAKTSVIAHPFPFKVGLKFNDGQRIAYIGLNSGEKATAVLVVTNQGTIADDINIGFSVTPEGWTNSFDISTVSLAAGASQEVKVTLKTQKGNPYYNYGIDVVGRSMGGGVTDKVLIFISFLDIIAKSGGNYSFHGNHSDPHTGGTPATNITPTIPDPEDKGWTLTGTQLAVIFVMFGAGFIGAIAIYQIYLIRSKTGLKGILKDFYKKLYDAETSDAYRKAIFKAYSQMCEEIAQHGHARAESITPKEFERQIREYLPIDKRNLHTLTKLFEEARYSDHAFSESNKKQALSALEGIIVSLENVTSFEEVKEKNGWFKKNN